jgi:carbonic anhydrase
MHHGTSAALEFGVCFLKVEHLIILGHSQCGGIQALLTADKSQPNDFIHNWVSLIKTEYAGLEHTDECAQAALHQSYENCLTFPWIRSAIESGALVIHLWFFDIKTGLIYAYSDEIKGYKPLELSDNR